MINKAIYSFWTKPMNDTYVGFNSEKVLIECMTLSAGFCRRYFSKVDIGHNHFLYFESKHQLLINSQVVA